jgi:RHS repeat-associated protein
MQPTLSIDYSSGAPTTYLGRGFSLNGESAISRCQQTFARDGAPRAVRFDGDDAFCLDGKRLVLVSGTNGKPGAVYATEIEDNRKVVIDSADPDGPLQWSVYDPSGLVHRYGVTAAGRLEGSRVAGTRGTVSGQVTSSAASRGRLRWLRETTQDRFGNGISYEYDIVDGPAERVLHRIEYTTQTAPGAPPADRSVEFTYELRTDHAHAFIGGLKLGQSRLLTRIEATGPASGGAGPVYRTYELSYTTGMTGEPLLDTFTECDEKLVCKQPLHFSWTTSADDLQAPFTDYNTHLQLFTGPSPKYGMNAWERIHAGDFTGDGADDLIVLKSDHFWYVLPSNFGPYGSNSFGAERKALYEPALEVSSGGAPLNVSYPMESYTRYADTDFDNRVDILHIASTRTFADPQTGLLLFEGDYQNCRNTGQATPAFACTFSENQPTLNFFSKSYIGDFDGNGRPDLIRETADPARMNVGGMVAAMSISAGAPYAFTSVGSGLLTSPFLPSYVLDTDGDSRDEMITSEVVPDGAHPGQFVATGWLNAFNLDSSGAGQPRPMNLPSVDTLQAASGDMCPGYLFADVNGDGLDDAIAPSCAHEPDLYLNSGNGFLPPVPASSNRAGVVAPPRYLTKNDSVDNGMRVIDVNRDGRQDILNTYNSTPFVSALVATPAGTFKTVPLMAVDPATGTPHPIPSGDQAEDGPEVTQVLDVNGDGAQDFIQFVNGELHVYVAKSVPADYLQGIEQVHGQFDVQVSYASGADHQVVGAWPAQTTFPQIEGTGRGLWVARQLTVRNGTGGSAFTQTHRYSRPVIDPGYGLLGFAVHEVKDASTTTTYEFDQSRAAAGGVPYATLGLPTRITTQTGYDALGHALSTRTDTQYQVISGQVPGKTVRVLLASQGEMEEQSTAGSPLLALLASTDTTFSKFDAFGNPQLQVTSMYDTQGIAQTAERSSTYDDYVSGGAWMIGLERDVCTTAHDALGRSEQRCSTTSHDPSTGAVLTQTLEPGNPDFEIKETFVPDAYGNVSDIQTADASGHLRKEHWGYDGDLVYRTSYTNALRQTELTTVQPGLGVTVAVTDVNGNTTGRQVDGFGREKAVAYPGGDVTRNEITDGGSSASLGIATIVTSTSASKSGAEKTYYDGFGRVLFYDVTDIHGRILRQENHYDPATGWLSAQIGPYALPGPPGQADASTVYSRDVMGRPLTVNVSGAVTTYAYDGAVETVTDPVGHVTRVTEGVLGVSKVERLDEHNNPVTTAFEYGPFGLVTGATQLARNGTRQTTSYGYDVLGRSSQVTDESGVTTKTTYSPLGDLVTTTESDPSGAILETTTSTYDDLGRLLTSSDGNRTFRNVYTYDTAPHGIGQIALGTSLDGVVSEFTYDARSRPQAETTTYNGESYTFADTYDSFGRLATESFPSPSGATSLAIDYDPVAGVVSRLSSGGTALWTLRDMDNQGNVTRADLGNGLTEGAAFDLFGHPTELYTQTASGQRVRDLGYEYFADGNMRTRRDRLAGTEERFTHDFLDRLTTQTVYKSDQVVSEDGQRYDDFGNIRVRTRFGESLTYYYNTGPAPHGDNAVTELHSASRDMYYEYDARGNQTLAHGTDTDSGTLRQAPSRSVKYTGFDLPRTITESDWNASGHYVTTRRRYVYDAFNRQVAQQFSTGELVIERGTEFRRTRGNGKDTWQVTLPGLTDALASISTDAASGTSSLSYLDTDALGSLDTVTDDSGNVIGRSGFTAWGEARGAASGSATAAAVPGFTGARSDTQELIDMNGRFYDALSARFLSEDPLNADPTDSQSYNGYTYALNMPMALTDPSGMQVEQDWGDAHAGGAATLPTEQPLGDSLDPIPVLPLEQLHSAPSAIQAHAADADAGIAPVLADDQVINANDQVINPGSQLIDESPTGWLPDETVAKFVDFLQKIQDAAGNAGESATDFAVTYGPVVKEAAFQTAMTIGDFAGTAIKVVLTLGPNGCKCNLPSAQSQIDAFSERQSGRHQDFLDVRAQAAEHSGAVLEKSPWPPNRGFLGEPVDTTLEAGTRVDRYGGPGGTFVSPEGTSFEARSLRSTSINQPYNVYEVVKPVTVKGGIAAPGFGYPGGGIQFEFGSSIQDLIDQGILKRMGP